jgi:hypothetical protein
MKKVIFSLASARSGTLYLRNLFRLNARNCAGRHETFFDFGNPTMFGPAIYDAYEGHFGKIRMRLERKRGYIQKLPEEVYFESSHAFLKSSWVAALDYFPNLQLIHLVRDPIKVAASEAYRESWRRRLRAPFHFYKGTDGQRHFAWALTGNEEIFQHFADHKLSLFQWYLIQWIEIENRAINFLSQNNLHDRCFTLDARKIRSMFDFLGVETKQPQIIFGGRKNKSLGYFASEIPHEEELQYVLGHMPERYLKIFEDKPYRDFAWSARFQLLRHQPIPPPPTLTELSLARVPI